MRRRPPGPCKCGIADRALVDRGSHFLSTHPDRPGTGKQVVIMSHEDQSHPFSAPTSFWRLKTWGKTPDLGSEYVAGSPDLPPTV